MKNPFVMMALMAAAMSAAFSENAQRDAGIKMPSFGGHGSREPGKRNPAGTKMVRKFYRNKHGVKADRQEAVKWYAAQKVKIRTEVAKGTAS